MTTESRCSSDVINYLDRLLDERKISFVRRLIEHYEEKTDECPSHGVDVRLESVLKRFVELNGVPCCVHTIHMATREYIASVFTLRMAGASYYQSHLLSELGGATRRYVTVTLRRDRSNTHDSNAIGVWCGVTQIGWIPKDVAAHCAAKNISVDGVTLPAVMSSSPPNLTNVWVDLDPRNLAFGSVRDR
jgi:hypothetical protein